MVEDRMRGLKMRVPVPGLRIKLIPTSEELATCAAFGGRVAGELVGRRSQQDRVLDLAELA